MSVDTKLKELIINTLSPEQLPEQPSETEIYLVEDDKEYATVEELAEKQDKLTAGTGISIDDNNVISASGAVESVNGKTGTVVLTGEDIAADVSELTDTVQGHLQTLHDNIKDIELFKFPNATIIGEPVIQSGQVSGFSPNDYLQFPFIVDLHNQPFVIDFCFTTGDDVTTQQNILDSQFGLALAIANGKGLMAISHNGTSWAGAVTGTMDIDPNTTYYARLSWNRINYQTQLSKDGTIYTPDMNFGSTQSPYPRTMFIGGCSGSAIGHTPHPFKGTINMNEAYLTVSGNVIWQGMDDAGLATRMASDVSNITEEGKERIKQIAGGSGSGRNIGDIFYTKRTDTALAGAVECNGGIYNTQDYTGAGSIGELLADDKLDYISLSDYATAISTKGWCDKIGWDGGTTVRVPTLTPHIIQKNNIPVVGTGKVLGMISGSYEGGLMTGWNANELKTTIRANLIGATPTTWTDNSPGQIGSYGVTTNADNSGIIADTTDTAQLRVMIQLASGATDEALEVCTQVLADVSGLKDMSNITATGKEAVVGWGMPDYSAGVSVSANTDYTADFDGRLICYCTSAYSGGGIEYITVHGQVVSTSTNSYEGYRGSLMADISKGESFRITKNTSGTWTYTFYPMKGV